MKGIILITFLFLGSLTFAQQESQFSNAFNNPYLFNPAAGGMTSVMQFEFTSRSQWMGYNGGPRTFVATGNSPIKIGSSKQAVSSFNEGDETFFKNPEKTTGSVKHIVGGKMSHEGIGPFVRTAVNGSYSIHVPFSKTVNVGLGIGIGWSNFGILQDRVILYESDDNTYEQFIGNSSSQNILDANAGLVFYNKSFVGGFSTSQVLNNNLVFDGTETESNLTRHFYFHGAYDFEASSTFDVSPIAMIKLTQNSPFSGDFGLRFRYNKASWLTLQYRTGNSMVFQVGSNLIKNLYVSYAYEHGFGPIRTTSNATHEIQLGMYLGKNRNIKKELKDEGN